MAEVAHNAEREFWQRPLRLRLNRLLRPDSSRFAMVAKRSSSPDRAFAMPAAPNAPNARPNTTRGNGFASAFPGSVNWNFKISSAGWSALEPGWDCRPQLWFRSPSACFVSPAPFWSA